MTKDSDSLTLKERLLNLRRFIDYEERHKHKTSENVLRAHLTKVLDENRPNWLYELINMMEINPMEGAES